MGHAGLWLSAAAVLGILVIRWRGFFGKKYGLSQMAGWVDRGLLVTAGLLLIFPGPLTDLLGLALLIPPLRAWVRDSMCRRAAGAMAGKTASRVPPENADPLRSQSDDRSRRPFLGAEKARDVEFHQIPRPSGEEETSGSPTVPREDRSG